MIPTITVSFEVTRNGLRVRIDSGGQFVRAEFSPESWMAFVSQGSRMIGLPAPWSAER